MVSSNKKRCIQKRIFDRISKRLPEFILSVSLISFITVFEILEYSPYSYSDYLQKLNYAPQIRDLVNLIVTTDGFIIAFTGVIATIILRHMLEKQEREIEGSAAIVGKDGIRDIILQSPYEEIRNNIIKFIWFILLMLFLSIGFSLGVIITQSFNYVKYSMIFLFVGAVELIGMISYSLKV